MLYWCFVRLIKIFISFIIVQGVLFSCSTPETSISEGKITYDITYPNPIEDKWLERLMPKEMEMYFNPVDVKTEISFGLGMIQINYLTDFENKQMYEMLKFMKKKNFALRDHDSIEQMISSIPEHKVKFYPDTKSIAGVLCKRAVVSVNGEIEPYSFDCWYTNQIKITEPNWCTPFKGIDGVLMQYRVERFNILMEFTANQVSMEKVPKETFSVPEKYKQISTEAMKASLEELKDI